MSPDVVKPAFYAGFFCCAGHAQQLEGCKSLNNLMVVKD